MYETRLTDILDQAKATYEVLPHARTETALDEAHALGLPEDDVAKTVVVEIREGTVRAVIPASRRLDLHKLREALGGTGKPRLATEDELGRDYPEFELGSVPPIGGAHRDRVVVDARLAELDSVVVEAGSHGESLRVRTADLLLVSQAVVADICAG